MSKFILIIIILIIVLLILLGAFLYLRLNKNQPQENKQSDVEKAKTNALSKAVKTSTEGDMLLVNNSDYQIVYLKESDQFLLSINKTPFEQIRGDAEEEFRKITRADKETVCKLNVTVSTPSFANPSLGGKVFPLSFCK